MRQLNLISKQTREADLFSNAFHYAPIGMFLVDLDGTIIVVNPAALAMLGYEEHELHAKTYLQITHPSDRSKGKLLMERLVKGEIDNFQMHKSYLKKSGDTVTTMLSVSLVHDELGNPRYYIAQLMDISEKTTAQSEVKQLTKHISTILDSILDAFFSIDNQYRFIYTNAAAQKLFKRSESELIGQNIWEILPWIKGTITQQEYVLAMENREQRLYEQFIPQLNHWFEANVYPSEFGLSVHFRQITERKRTADKLLESEKSFRMLAENTSDMISKHNLDGLYTYVSPACYALLGYRDIELIGKSPFLLYHPDDKERMLDNQRQIYDHVDENTISYRIKRKDGVYRWFESTARVVLHDGDRTQTIVSVSRDITPRKEIELKMLEQYQIMHALSHVDELTTIANRRSFDEIWNNEWEDAHRHHMPVTLMIGDIDNFKAYNDTFGHQKGDECLKQIAAAMRSALKRPLDIVTRYGGEEFGIILPQTSKERATTIARRLLEAVAQLKIPHSDKSGSTYVTISLGSATWEPDSPLSQNELFALADRALYQAKHEGKNRYITS